MQKVVGSNPISRFEEVACFQVFRGALVGWTFCYACVRAGVWAAGPSDPVGPPADACS